MTAEASIQRVVLILADISGYTKFMLANDEDLQHSQEVISQLMSTIIEEVKVPLHVSKLEGDAVFLYAVRDDQTWIELQHEIRQRLLTFISNFRSKLSGLIQSTQCGCGACLNMDALKLKLIVHSGRALLYRIGNFDELSGFDVILAHRLLKNSIASKEYILFTETAVDDGLAGLELPLEKSIENYDDVGSIHVQVHYP